MDLSVADGTVAGGLGYMPPQPSVAEIGIDGCDGAVSDLFVGAQQAILSKTHPQQAVLPSIPSLTIRLPRRGRKEKTP